jgi:hypothetical protein
MRALKGFEHVVYRNVWESEYVCQYVELFRVVTNIRRSQMDYFRLVSLCHNVIVVLRKVFELTVEDTSHAVPIFFNFLLTKSSIKSTSLCKNYVISCSHDTHNGHTCARRSI